MERDYPLDRDIVFDKNGNIYVILTNYNPYGYVFAYLKYVNTGRGIWRGYERTLKYYGIKNLLNTSQNFLFEPCYDVTFPVLLKSEITIHLKPEIKVREILNHTYNELEYRAIEILEKIGTNNTGITGSLLAGISHKSSDIDIILYGCKKTIDYIENPIYFEEDKDWIRDTISNYNLDLELAKRLYDKRRRGVYKGTKVSILFNSGISEKYCKKACRKIGSIKVRGVVSGDCNALFYPSTSYLYDSSPRIDLVVSYEGIYSSLLYGERKVEIYGMLMECEDEKIVIIGDREIGGYVRPL